MTTDFSKFKKTELTKPRDKAWENFAKFEKEGDKVEGILRDVFYRPAEGDFKEQRGFTLEQEDGILVNVAMKREPYFAIRSTDEVHLGDLLTIELGELRASKTKGYSATKIFSFTAGTLEENASNPTVKELEAIDMKAEGVEDDADTEDEDKPPFEEGASV
jgi:hypothetical protein